MKTRNKILGLGIFVIIIGLMVFAWTNFREKPVEGSKQITISVVNSEGKTTSYDLSTDAEFVIGAMEEAKEQGLSYEGEEGEYGFSISHINGERADYNQDGAYWSLLINEEYANYGVSQQPIKNGDEVKLVYTKAN